MINYATGKWGITFVFQLAGSVFPKAVCWALPNACLALFLHHYVSPGAENPMGYDVKMAGVSAMWGAYSFVLGFLIVFRNNMAYARFWDGTSAFEKVRGEWLNAAGSVISFCSQEPEKAEKVREFQHLFIRIMSIQYAVAIQRVCELEDPTMPIIDPTGMDELSLDFLKRTAVDERTDIPLQWLNRMLIDADGAGLFQAAPPVIARAYQDLSRGKVWLQQVRMLRDVPFPFPYAQMISCMLLIHFFMTPVLASQIISRPFWAAIVCFFVVLAFWSLLYIAFQIDNPFGDDLNDLPVRDMVSDFNHSLLTLLEPKAQVSPAFRLTPEGKQKPSLMKSWTTGKCDEFNLKPMYSEGGQQMARRVRN
eukprot:TRINITY_DN7341_c0_g1_i1.p1 TRINITY_DN7341_c0_g1~~TRINITY_DN7341_c0_g1_i1.p1  ORF type:complete len:364 (+),score=61.94 TRINITY_DN7341_c0_g1_i1:97-1188(+)